MLNADEIIKKINELRRDKSYVSNAFLTKPQLDVMLSLENTQVIMRDDILLILEENPDLIRLYFYSSKRALERMRYLLPNCSKSIIADIVGKNPQAENLSKHLTENGFIQYSIFIRMTCDSPLILDNSDVSRVTHATSEDLDDIYSLLYSEFDPLFSHLPEKNDILTAISKSEITIVRIEKEIAGLAYFEVISAPECLLALFYGQ